MKKRAFISTLLSLLALSLTNSTHMHGGVFASERTELSNSRLEPAPMDSERFRSHYVDMADHNGIRRDITLDYEVISDKNLNQSLKIQSAIDDIAKAGGGILYFPYGEYCFSGVKMRSNVHILVAPNTTFHAAWNQEHKIVMLSFSGKSGKSSEYLENASIRCVEEGRRFTVDFGIPNATSNWAVRFSTIGYVKNFLIADIDFIDNFSIYCAMSISATAPAADESESWEITYAHNGEVRNCSTYNAHPGYGLIQMHSAKNIYCENLYAKGGVTLRLETGAGNAQGVHDIYGKNLQSEAGRAAVMMAPHRAQNGTVLIDGVWSKGSCFAVKAGKGFNDSKDSREGGHATRYNPNKYGANAYFADDSRVINIHSIYGNDSQIRKDFLYILAPELHSDVRWEMITKDNVSKQRYKWLFGPSCTAVQNTVDGAYDIEISGITTEGFTYNQDGIIYDSDPQIAPRKEQKWNVLRDWESKHLGDK